MVSLIRGLTWRLCTLASGEVSFHFPLFTNREAIDFGDTGQGLGLQLLPVSLLIVAEALRLEWVKSILLIAFSYLRSLFSPRTFIRISLFACFSFMLTFLELEKVISHSESQLGIYWFLLPCGIEDFAAMISMLMKAVYETDTSHEGSCRSFDRVLVRDVNLDQSAFLKFQCFFIDAVDFGTSFGPNDD